MAIAIFDWDDTLCPTHWMYTNGLFAYHVPTHEQWNALQQHGASLKNLLTRAHETCERVYILTNSMHKWVYTTVERFFPACAAILEHIEICHAWKDIHIEVEQWKTMYLNDHLRHLQDATNILCFGDRDNDTNTMIAFFQGKNAKILQLQEAPSALVCTKQLEHIYALWDKLYTTNKSTITYL